MDIAPLCYLLMADEGRIASSGYLAESKGADCYVLAPLTLRLITSLTSLSHL